MLRRLKLSETFLQHLRIAEVIPLLIRQVNNFFLIIIFNTLLYKFAGQIAESCNILTIFVLEDIYEGVQSYRNLILTFIHQVLRFS